MAKIENTNQIAKISGNNSFVEFNRDGFGIDKIHMGFYKYDESKESGSRIIAEVQIYMSMPEFLSLSVDIASCNMLRRKLNFDKNGEKYGSLFEKMGGSSKARLEAKKKPRTDGMAESRTFKMQPSSAKNCDYALMAVSGAGEEIGTGLIKPAYKKPDVQIIIPISHMDMVGVCEKVKIWYQAYMTLKMSEYLKKDIEIAKQKLENSGYRG